MTILREPKSPSDPEALALAALGWVLTDGDRAQRLLALTGLTPEALRSGLHDRVVLASVLEFLMAHEPDLVAAAEDLGFEPAELVAAAQELDR